MQDATHTNGAAEWALFEQLLAEGALRQAVSMMEGADNLEEMPERSGGVRRGPVKVMPRELEHEFHPSTQELAPILQRIEAAGRKAAVHAVTRRGVDTVLDAFETLGRRARGHRIEHCGVCTEAQANRIARLGLVVVTQPGFLYDNGDLMLRRLPAGDLPDFYPLRHLLDAGVLVAGSSDAPVIEPDVICGLRAAVRRRSRSGQDMGAAQAVSPAEALAMFTSSAAMALGVEQERGAIARGLAGDFVVLRQHPGGDSAVWDDMAIDMTIQAGDVVYEAGRPYAASLSRRA
jgi:predicted amidohydrolase YtcJ